MRRLLLACCMAAVATAQEAEIRALLPQLGAEDFRVREEAERRLEALVREGGQASFDFLESTVLPEAQAGSDIEIRIRVARVVRRLGGKELLWWTQLGESLMWSPTVAAGHGVVVRTGSSGLDVLDAATGAVRWSKTGAFVWRPAGTAKGFVYATRPSDAVAAYRSADGEAVWTHEVADIGGDSGRTRRWDVIRGGKMTKEERPLAPEEWSDLFIMSLHVPEWDRVLVATQGGYLAALDAKGERIWTRNGVAGSPRVWADRRLVFMGGSKVVALDADSGEERWSAEVEGLDGIAEGASHGRVFATAIPTVEGRIDGRLHAFDAATGKPLWTFKPPVGADEGTADGVTIIRQRAGTIRRGTISHPGDETRMSRVQVVAKNEIAITATSGHIFGLKASDGTILWRVERQGIRLASVEKDGLVWGVSDGGEVVALDPRNGKVAERIDLMKLDAAEDAPKLEVQRGVGPAAEDLGELSDPVFLGDVCYVTTGAGSTLALRIGPFRSRSVR